MNANIKLITKEESKEDNKKLVSKTIRIDKKFDTLLHELILRMKKEHFNTSMNKVIQLILLEGMNVVLDKESNNEIKNLVEHTLTFDEVISKEQVMHFVENLENMNYIKAGEKVSMTKGKSLKLLIFLKELKIIESIKTKGTIVLRKLTENDFV